MHSWIEVKTIVDKLGRSFKNAYYIVDAPPQITDWILAVGTKKMHKNDQKNIHQKLISFHIRSQHSRKKKRTKKMIHISS